MPHCLSDRVTNTPITSLIPLKEGVYMTVAIFGVLLKSGDDENIKNVCKHTGSKIKIGSALTQKLRSNQKGCCESVLLSAETAVWLSCQVQPDHVQSAHNYNNYWPYCWSSGWKEFVYF